MFCLCIWLRVAVRKAVWYGALFYTAQGRTPVTLACAMVYRPAGGGGCGGGQRYLLSPMSLRMLM